MNDRQNLVGTVKTAFELHSFHGDQWLVVKEAADLRDVEPAAALLVQRAEVDGIRLVRRTDYVDHDFTTTVTLVKRLRAGVVENDPLQRANPGRDSSWCDKPEDLYGDIQRQVFRGILSKYLDERRLTPLEVLHHEKHAKTLDQAGTTVQGALQRLASVQVRGTKLTAVTRMKELMNIVEQGLSALLKDSKLAPPLAMAPGNLAALSAEAAKAGDPAPKLYRGIANTLLDAKTWLEKLDRLFQLWLPELGVREMRVLDSLAAEILASPFALKELAGEEKTRFQLVTNAIDLYVGNMAGASAKVLPGVQVLSRLLSDGVLPRSIAELRLGLLRHLHSRLPLKGGGLREEVRATVEVLEYLKSHAPTLARDEEVLEALATRVDRLIQPESMAELMGQSRSVMMRIEAVLTLMEQAPGEAPKVKLAPYLRSLLVPDDVIRETGGFGPSRSDAIKPIIQLIQRINAVGLPATPRRELVEVLDSAVYELIRGDILSNNNIPFADRILTILRLCPGLPDGRAKSLASDTLAQALARPEFILRYLERFPGAQEKKDAFSKLCSALIDSGLVSPTIVANIAA